MKDQIFGVLQRVGRSFMLPIAVLPVAGLLLGIGSSFTNATMIDTYGLQAILGEGTILNMFLTVLSKAGSALFDNLPIIFAVGCAIGMAKKEKEVAALSAVIAYFTMNAAVNAMLVNSGQILDDGSIADFVLQGTITNSVGIQTLQMGVFGGIIVGLNCRMRWHFSAAAVLFRSSARLYMYWWASVCSMCGRWFRTESMRLADW